MIGRMMIYNECRRLAPRGFSIEERDAQLVLTDPGGAYVVIHVDDLASAPAGSLPVLAASRVHNAATCLRNGLRHDRMIRHG